MSDDLVNKSSLAFAWDEQGQSLEMMSRLVSVRTGFPRSKEVHATPACIIPAGTTVPIKFCTSGWRPQQEPFDILDNDKWTLLVREFSQATGFRLRGHIRDVQHTNDPEVIAKNTGRFLACHAEKKLGLFFLTQQMGRFNVSLQDALQGRFHQLDLPLACRQAKIVLGHKPCKNCQSSKVFDRHVRSRRFYDSNGQRENGPRRQGPSDPFDEQLEAEARHSNSRAGDEQDENHEVSEVHENVENDLEVDENQSLISDSLLAPISSGNVQRSRIVLVDSDDDDNGDDEINASEHTRCRRGSPFPLSAVERMSVLSSPSPSLPSVSLHDSPLGHRYRFPPFSASPPRIGGTAPPPPQWGPRGKPPATPCFVAPSFMRGAGGGSQAAGSSSITNTRANDNDRPPTVSSRAGSSIPSMAHQASYFFASASPEAGQAVDLEVVAGPAAEERAAAPPQAGEMHPPPTPSRAALPLSHTRPPRQMSEASDDDVEFLMSTVSPERQGTRQGTRQDHRVQRVQRVRQVRQVRRGVRQDRNNVGHGRRTATQPDIHIFDSQRREWAPTLGAAPPLRRNYQASTRQTIDLTGSSSRTSRPVGRQSATVRRQHPVSVWVPLGGQQSRVLRQTTARQMRSVNSYRVAPGTQRASFPDLGHYRYEV